MYSVTIINPAFKIKVSVYEISRLEKKLGDRGIKFERDYDGGGYVYLHIYEEFTLDELREILDMFYISNFQKS